MRLTCSAEKIWTGWSTAIAVPSALVPAACSLQSAPQTKCMFSVASMTCWWPSIHNSTPRASEITSMWPARVVASDSRSRSTGSTAYSGWCSQRSAIAASSMTTGARLSLGSMPASPERAHDCSTTART